MKNLDYGIIGNCRSAALIYKTGSINWCCLPEFDSSSVFGKLLDNDKGGSFEFLVSKSFSITQAYLENTCILETTFSNGDDIFKVCDFMPRYYENNKECYSPPDIIRYIKHISGKPRFRIIYDPNLEYAAFDTKTRVDNDFIESITSEDKFDTLYLYTNLNKNFVLDGNEIELIEDAYFLISYNEKVLKPTIGKMFLELNRTIMYWLNWSYKIPKYKNYNREIVRSALTLKLLSYDKSGAVLAAATTSLPETIGEVRNWDYRFCWIRDASMVIKVVSKLGHKNMVKRYLQFIIDLIPDKDEKLQIMYGINKEKELTETILDHLSGYENSKPVRIGNAAYKQAQNDIYGILMDVIHEQLVMFNTNIDNCEELWSITKGIVWEVNKHWKKADKGIWEFREEDRHFTFSKVLCWVAIDRALKVASILGKTSKNKKWNALEQDIKKDILENAWNEDVQSFTQSYNSKDLDASILLMEPYGFIEATDIKYVKTVKSIERELSNDGLMYRYKNEDDFGLPSSSFTICTFWFINAVYKIGEHRKAIDLFDQLLSYSNHLGLFSEDIDFKTKRLLGNFPQAYSHLALIETATNLSEITHEEELMGVVNLYET